MIRGVRFASFFLLAVYIISIPKFKMVMIMELLFKILLGISKTGLYVLIDGLFLGKRQTFLRKINVYLMGGIIAVALSISNYYEDEWMVALTPFVVLSALTILGMLTEGKKDIFLSVTSAIEAYVISFLI